jgi:hypothetical protein
MEVFDKRRPVRGGAGRGGWWEDFFFSGMEEIAMKCHRCGGIMVLERFYGASDHFSGWRCVLCGEIVDPVIFENRRRQKR